MIIDNKDEGAFACSSDGKFQCGLTKREFLAGLAMQGFCSVESFTKYPTDDKGIAKTSVYLADALIKELDKDIVDE